MPAAPPARAHPASSDTASSQGPSPEPGERGRLRFVPSAGTRAAFAREADEVREPAGPGIDVDGPGQHGRIGVEDRLRAVAVMGVDVEHRDRPPQRVRELRRRRGRVVQVAGAAERRSGCVVTGGAAAGVGGRGAGGDEVGGGQRGVDGRPGGLPGARSDQGHRVVGEAAGPGARRGRHALGKVADQARVSEQVRNDPILARVLGEPRRKPVGPGAGQVADQLRVVITQGDVVGMPDRFDQRSAGRLDHDADRIGAGRQLGPRGADADPDLAAGLVAPMEIAPDQRNRQRHRPTPITALPSGRIVNRLDSRLIWL